MCVFLCVCVSLEMSCFASVCWAFVHWRRQQLSAEHTYIKIRCPPPMGGVLLADCLLFLMPHSFSEKQIKIPPLVALMCASNGTILSPVTGLFSSLSCLVLFVFIQKCWLPFKDLGISRLAAWFASALTRFSRSVTPKGRFGSRQRQGLHGLLVITTRGPTPEG